MLAAKRATLIVLDNIESLLTSKVGAGVTPNGSHLIDALLEQPHPPHASYSPPASTARQPLANHPHLLSRESIHALSLPESVLLARELTPPRAPSSATKQGHTLLQTALS